MVESPHIISADLGLRLLQSFGSMRVTMGFLEPLEQIWMQLICKWFYIYGVSRVQTRISLGKKFFFPLDSSSGRVISVTSSGKTAEHYPSDNTT